MLDEIAYFNHATTSYPKLRRARETYESALDAVPLDIRHSAAEGSDIERSRHRVARVLCVPVDSVYFTSGATLAINQVINGYLRAGDECIVDNRSHNAVTRTLHGLDGTAFREVPLCSDEEILDYQCLLEAITERTRLICLTHTSNVTGSVYELADLIDHIHNRFPEVAVLVDACQSAGITSLNEIREADFVVFTGHKHLHSVPGAAVVVANRSLRPIIFGGTGTHSADQSLEWSQQNLIEVGTLDSPAALALATALEVAHETANVRAEAVNVLVSKVWERLERLSGVRLLGRPPGQRRTGIVSFLPEVGAPESEWVPLLAAQGIIVRGGLLCSPGTHDQLGTGSQGALRISVSPFNTENEVDSLLSAIQESNAFLRKGA